MNLLGGSLAHVLLVAMMLRAERLAKMLSLERLKGISLQL